MSTRKTVTVNSNDAASTENIDEETGLVSTSGAGDGILSPSDLSTLLNQTGFCQNRTIKIGDPEKEGIIAYSGEVIGPGPDIELNSAMSKGDEEKKYLPTWQCHPFSLKTMDVVRNVIDIVICTRGLDDIFKRAAALKQSTPDSRVQVAIQWTGKGENRLGQPLNHYRHAVRLTDKDGKPLSR